MTGVFSMCIKRNACFTLKLSQLSIQWHSKLSFKRYLEKKATRNSGLDLSICRQRQKVCYLDSWATKKEHTKKNLMFSNTISFYYPLINCFLMRKGIRTHVKRSFFVFSSQKVDIIEGKDRKITLDTKFKIGLDNSFHLKNQTKTNWFKKLILL